MGKPRPPWKTRNVHAFCATTPLPRRFKKRARAPKNPKKTRGRGRRGHGRARRPRDSGPRASREGSGRNLNGAGRRVRARFTLSGCQEVKAAGISGRRLPLPPPSPERPANPQAEKGQGPPRSERRLRRLPRPRPRAVAASPPEGDREEGPRGPGNAQKPPRQNRNLPRKTRSEAQPGPRRPAGPALPEPEPEPLRLP